MSCHFATRLYTNTCVKIKRIVSRSLNIEIQFKSKHSNKHTTVVQNDLKVEALLVKDLEIPVFVEKELNV